MTITAHKSRITINSNSIPAAKLNVALYRKIQKLHERSAVFKSSLLFIVYSLRKFGHAKAINLTKLAVFEPKIMPTTHIDTSVKSLEKCMYTDIEEKGDLHFTIHSLS